MKIYNNRPHQNTHQVVIWCLALFFGLACISGCSGVSGTKEASKTESVLPDVPLVVNRVMIYLKPDQVKGLSEQEIKSLIEKEIKSIFPNKPNLLTGLKYIDVVNVVLVGLSTKDRDTLNTLIVELRKKDYVAIPVELLEKSTHFVPSRDLIFENPNSNWYNPRTSPYTYIHWTDFNRIDSNNHLTYEGRGVTVAVIDSGVNNVGGGLNNGQTTPGYFGDRLLPGYSVTECDGDSTVFPGTSVSDATAVWVTNEYPDCLIGPSVQATQYTSNKNSHGTQVAGLIAGRTGLLYYGGGSSIPANNRNSAISITRSGTFLPVTSLTIHAAA